MAATALASCTGLPASGPSAKAILSTQENDKLLPYTVVQLTGDVAQTLAANPPQSLSRTFGAGGPASAVQFGVGDLVSVTIFEAASGGLFLPAEGGSRAGNFVNIPDQAVDKNGNISVPYAGTIKARGRTAIAIQRDIQNRLVNRAIEPQAVVTLKDQRSAYISVLGEVNAPARLPLSASGERMADAIARAGGPRARGYETYVTLQRDDKRGTVNMTDIIDNDENNIYLRQGDTIFVKSEARTFMAFGATGESGQFDFQKERITLSEAIGKARGLLDERAEPASVFLYRAETRDRAAKVGVDLSAWQGASSIPVVYALNLRDPSGFFIAGVTPVRGGDIVYIDNATGAEAAKFISLIRGGIGATNDVANVVK